MATRLSLRTKVKINLGNRTDKDSVINDGLEEGLKRAMEVYPFKTRQTETDITIVENDTHFHLPTDTLDLIEARLIDGTSSYPIAIKDKKWLTDRWANIAACSTGKPVFGYEENGIVYLYPISNGSYTIRITTRVKPTFNALDATENPIPTLDFALVCFATSYVFMSVQLFDFAIPWDNKFVGAVTSAINVDKRSRDTAVVKKFEPFGEEVPPVIEPYLNPFDMGR